MSPDQLQAQLKPQLPHVDILVKIEDGRFGLCVTSKSKQAPPGHVVREYHRVNALLLGEGLRSDADLGAQLLHPEEATIHEADTEPPADED